MFKPLLGLAVSVCTAAAGVQLLKDLKPITAAMEAAQKTATRVTAANVVFAIQSLVDPSAYPAIYGCRLVGITKTGQSGGFSATSTDPIFRLVPTPTLIEGMFAW